MIAQELILLQKLHSAKLNERENTLAQHSMTVLSDARIYIDDTPAITDADAQQMYASGTGRDLIGNRGLSSVDGGYTHRQPSPGSFLHFTLP